jgi:hypothetical protein
MVLVQHIGSANRGYAGKRCITSPFEIVEAVKRRTVSSLTGLSYVTTDS